MTTTRLDLRSERKEEVPSHPPLQYEWMQLLLLQPVADAYKLRLSSVIGLSDYKEHKLLQSERERERESKRKCKCESEESCESLRTCCQSSRLEWALLPWYRLAVLLLQLVSQRFLLFQCAYQSDNNARNWYALRDIRFQKNFFTIWMGSRNKKNQINFMV